MQKKEFYNVHEVLNDFERHFPYKRIRTVVDYAYPPYLMVRADYADAPFSGEHWPVKSETDDWYNYRRRQSVMLKLWVHRDDPDPLNPATAGKLRITLWRDEIYINSYLMPDYRMAKEFFAAKRQWDGCLANTVFGCFNIALSEKQRLRALACTEEKLERALDNSCCLFKKKKPLDKKQFEETTGGIPWLLDAIRILQYELLESQQTATGRQSKLQKERTEK